jgi:hypothetical protein
MTPPILGIAVLDARFPRPRGDAGNPASYSVPVRVATVPSATVARIVRPGAPDATLLDPFGAALRKLAADGATLLTTSCGFLAAWQDALARDAPRPFVSSALCHVPALIAAGTPAEAIGVLSFDARSLGPAHFAGAGVPSGLAVGGLDPASHLYRVIAEDRPDLDGRQAEADAVSAARALVAGRPALTTLLLECTNLPPYRRAIAAATGRAVFDLFDALEAAAGRPLRAAATNFTAV